MIDLYLVRHGEAAASWAESEDPGLSDLGRQQALDTARSLRRKIAGPVDLISSPSLRAQETAVPLSKALALPVTIENAFQEIPSPVPLAQRQKWLLAIMRERWDQQDVPVRQWRDGLLGQLAAISTPSVIFTHFMVLNAIVGSIGDSHDIVCYMPDNASITHLRCAGGVLQLVEKGREIRTDVV